jgi:radical SAM protein with 4Fe4S-binding SPASM domain
MKLDFKHCYEDRFELKLVNRTEILTKKDLINFKKPCYLPFYKMFIDWNGDVIACSNDWGRRGKISNIMKKSINDIWHSDILENYRKKLFTGSRYELDPCKFCTIDGTIDGEDSVNIWAKNVL